jgi:formate hydrogenlyase subunit 6/NADH:ubiquinone oxidoreductase subunit I
VILERETYFPNPLYKRMTLFIKKFFYILFRFLGRPNWGRLRSGGKLAIEKNSLVLTVNEEGELNCTSCRLCVDACPTHCLQLSPAPGQGAPSAPAFFNFEPLKCITCNLCEDICPEGAIAFIPQGNLCGGGHTDWAKDLYHLAYREELNDGKGLTIGDVLKMRETQLSTPTSATKEI